MARHFITAPLTTTSLEKLPSSAKLSLILNDLLRANSPLLLFLVFLPFILLWPLHIYQQKHPLNFVFLGLFTASLSVTVGVTCANTDGRIVLEALILTSAVVFGLTGYTFWASKKGHDFSFLGPILFTSLIILVLTSFIQMVFPFGSTSVAIYSAMGAIVFSGYKNQWWLVPVLFLFFLQKTKVKLLNCPYSYVT
ncbi:ion channel [Lithospermum erythrorhizon]|uniref:Ion channel n=1 Tax=Lithospermum erythrorhizon TaxID=34254 RepID=A0AAV3RIP2_LITER